MELIADGVLILAALAAMAYCMVLSRRLRRLSELDGGLGAAITALSREVDHLSGALAEAKAATTDSATDLGAQCRAAHIAARRLETLVKSANKTVLAKASGKPPRESPSKTEAGKPRKSVQSDLPIAPEITPAAAAREEEKRAPITGSEAKTLPHAATKSAPPKQVAEGEASQGGTESADASDRLKDGSVTSLDPAALDQFIGAIIAKGDADDNAALARRLVMAIAGQNDARNS